MEKEQTVKEIALESLLKTIGYMVIIERKEYAKQLSDIYVELLDDNQ